MRQITKTGSWIVEHVPESSNDRTIAAAMMLFALGVTSRCSESSGALSDQVDGGHSPPPHLPCPVQPSPAVSSATRRLSNPNSTPIHRTSQDFKPAASAPACPGTASPNRQILVVAFPCGWACAASTICSLYCILSGLASTSLFPPFSAHYFTVSLRHIIVVKSGPRE